MQSNKGLFQQYLRIYAVERRKSASASVPIQSHWPRLTVARQGGPGGRQAEAVALPGLMKGLWRSGKAATAVVGKQLSFILDAGNVRLHRILLTCPQVSDDRSEVVLNSLAQDLWDARRLGYTISAARDDLPKTEDEAYEVQDAIAELSGLPRCGYKVGSTSKEAQMLLGTDEPGLGVLLTPFVHESPARMGIVPEQVPAVEGEFAFRIGRDLPPRAEPYTMAEVAEAIEGVAAAIEVVGTRFSGGLEGKGRLLTTADGGVNIALATGRWAEFSGQDLRAHRVTMTINDDLRGTGTGSRALGDPLNVMLWIANRQSERGVGLKAGEMVSTGTCTGLDFVQPKDVARADFGALGEVIIEFE